MGAGSPRAHPEAVLGRDGDELSIVIRKLVEPQFAIGKVEPLEQHASVGEVLIDLLATLVNVRVGLGGSLQPPYGLAVPVANSLRGLGDAGIEQRQTNLVLVAEAERSVVIAAALSMVASRKVVGGADRELVDERGAKRLLVRVAQGGFSASAKLVGARVVAGHTLDVGLEDACGNLANA